MSLEELKFIFGSKLDLATPSQIKRMDEHLWNDDIQKMRMVGYEIDEEPQWPVFKPMEYTYEPLTVHCDPPIGTKARLNDFVRERFRDVAADYDERLRGLRIREAELAINPLLVVKKEGGS